jgi:hypothetical protein
MRYEDLPPKLRAAVDAQLAVTDITEVLPAVAVRTGKSGRGGRWTCARCGNSYRAYAPAERHIDQEHHAGRIEWADR